MLMLAGVYAHSEEPDIMPFSVAVIMSVGMWVSGGLEGGEEVGSDDGADGCWVGGVVRGRNVCRVDVGGVTVCVLVKDLGLMRAKEVYQVWLRYLEEPDCYASSRGSLRARS